MHTSLRASRSPLRQSQMSSSRSQLGRSQMSPSRNVPGTAATAMTNRFPEHPTAETKLRLVFNELDVNQQKKVTVRNFRQVLKALNISFSNETIDHLFGRADLDKAGSINYTEFLNFTKNYPHLIETIYARSRQVIERVLRDGQLEQQRGEQEVLQRAERLLQQQWDVTKDELAAQQASCESVQTSVETAAQDVKDKARELVAAQNDLDYAKGERSMKERSLSDARDVEREALKPLRDMERNLDLSQERLTKTEAQLAASREKERQLEAMLEEAKRESQSHTETANELNDNLTEMRERASELSAIYEEAQGEVTRADREFQDVDEDVRSIRQSVEDLDALKSEAQAMLKELSASVALMQNDLAPFRQREETQRAKHQDAQKVYEAAERVFLDMERDTEAFEAARADGESSEQRVLDNEVVLRDQRTVLNSQDDQLWSEGGTFMVQTQRDDSRLAIAQGNTRGF